MNQFNLGNFLNKFVTQKLLNPGDNASRSLNSNATSDTKFQLSNNALIQNMVPRNLSQSSALRNFSSMNFAGFKMASSEKSLYLKDLLNLPKDIQEVLVMLQNNASANKGLSSLLNKNINLANLAQLMQINSKEAMSKLISAMTEASKQGITDLSQFKEAMKFINASVSVASQDNLNQVLKTFMLLYLPWLPLQEGVDFELEIETSQGENGEDETTLTILISTKNYGNVKILLILNGINSFDIFINCCEEFPKEQGSCSLGKV